VYDGSRTTMTMNQSRSAALSRRRAERSPPAEGRSKNRQSVRTSYERYLALARAQTLAGDQRGGEFLPTRRTLFPLHERERAVTEWESALGSSE